MTRDVCHTQTRVRRCHIRAGGGAGGGAGGVAGSVQSHQNTHEPSWSRSAQLCSRPNTRCLRTDRSGSARLDTVKLKRVKVATSGCDFQSKALGEEVLCCLTSRISLIFILKKTFEVIIMTFSLIINHKTYDYYLKKNIIIISKLCIFD